MKIFQLYKCSILPSSHKGRRLAGGHIHSWDLLTIECPMDQAASRLLWVIGVPNFHHPQRRNKKIYLVRLYTILCCWSYDYWSGCFYWFQPDMTRAEVHTPPCLSNRSPTTQRPHWLAHHHLNLQLRGRAHGNRPTQRACLQAHAGAATVATDILIGKSPYTLSTS